MTNQALPDSPPSWRSIQTPKNRLPDHVLQIPQTTNTSTWRSPLVGLVLEVKLRRKTGPELDRLKVVQHELVYGEVHFLFERTDASRFWVNLSQISFACASDDARKTLKLA